MFWIQKKMFCNKELKVGCNFVSVDSRKAPLRNHLRLKGWEARQMCEKLDKRVFQMERKAYEKNDTKSPKLLKKMQEWL